MKQNEGGGGGGEKCINPLCILKKYGYFYARPWTKNVDKLHEHQKYV